MATDAVTVPLRSCCPQCYSSIDKCISEGDHWQVHFSRGALRRRKSVSDAHTPSRTRNCLRDAMPGFDAIVAVDEIDRRRKSSEMDALAAFTIEMPPTSVGTSSGSERIPLRRALSLPDAVYPAGTRLLPDPLPRAFSPPIQEEDEQLPPRRTPVATPRDSLTDLRATRDTQAASATGSPDLEVTPAMEYTPSEDLNSSTDSKPPSSLISGLPDDDRETISPWFSSPASGHHERAFSDSPVSSPSSSPLMDHARAPSSLEPSLSRKKPLMGSIFRASTSVLKGFTSMGGVSMAV